MADLSDVTALLAQMAADAAYPGGTGQPSVTGAKVALFEGWPDPVKLDADIAAGGAQVSIFPTQAGSPQSVAQHLERQQTVIAPVHTLRATVDDDRVAVSGAPSPGEALVLIVNGSRTYSRTGDSVAAILQALLTDLASDFSGAALLNSTLLIPGAFSLAARSSAPGVAGIVTHRQKQQVAVTVWAPTAAVRAILAAAIDAAFKASLHVSFPDTSQGFLRYVTTRTSDERVNDTIYRRDLIYEVEYATLETYPVDEIAAFGATLDVGPSLIGHVANDVIAAG